MAEWSKIYTFEYYSNTKIAIMSKGLSDKIEQVREYYESQGCSPEEIDRRLFNPDDGDDIEELYNKIMRKAEIDCEIDKIDYMPNKIKNSLRAFIIGDALGVPFKYQKKWDFKCTGFVGGGIYEKEAGTWSGNTSIMLCLLDALTRAKDLKEATKLYKKNLQDWYYENAFTVDGTFDVGVQTRKSIELNFKKNREINICYIDNKALLYAPLTYYFTNENLTKEDFTKFCKITHNSPKCLYYGWRFCDVLGNCITGNSKSRYYHYINSNEPTNTFEHVIDYFQTYKDGYIDGSLFECLCKIINHGEDTNTNAALFGLLLGTEKDVDEKDWQQIRKHEFADKIIDDFIDKVFEFEEQEV